MIVPAVMFIEVGADELTQLSDADRSSQLKELRSFGDERARTLGATGLSPDLQLGYELGLATARALLACSGELVVKGVSAKDLL